MSEKRDRITVNITGLDVDTAADMLGVTKTQFVNMAANYFTRLVLDGRVPNGTPSVPIGTSDVPNGTPTPEPPPQKPRTEDEFVAKWFQLHDDDVIEGWIRSVWDIEHKPCYNKEMEEQRLIEATAIKTQIAKRRKKIAEERNKNTISDVKTS